MSTNLSLHFRTVFVLFGCILCPKTEMESRVCRQGALEAYRDNIGLLLFGNVGTGKSFFAGCIANALFDRDVPVLMTNFPSILNRLTGVFAENRTAFIASLDDYSLHAIDDLGVERTTRYAMEQMFTVIDSRYRSKKPLIVTTNLKLEEIKNPPDLAHARFFRFSQRKFCTASISVSLRFTRPENQCRIRMTSKSLCDKIFRDNQKTYMNLQPDKSSQAGKCNHLKLLL